MMHIHFELLIVLLMLVQKYDCYINFDDTIHLEIITSNNFDRMIIFCSKNEIIFVQSKKK